MVGQPMSASLGSMRFSRCFPFVFRHIRLEECTRHFEEWIKQQSSCSSNCHPFWLRGFIVSRSRGPQMYAGTVGIRAGRTPGGRRKYGCDWVTQLPLQFLILYVVALLFYLHVIGSLVAPAWRMAKTPPLSDTSLRAFATPIDRQQESETLGFAQLDVSPEVRRHQRMLCGLRADATRTIVVHMHIPKSGGTAFALALKSECRCRKIPRPQKGYCKECPHVLPDPELPVKTFSQNLWTSENKSFSPSYSANCKTYNASSRWFGFPKKNRTYTFYSQNRLTSGWPCGVHVGYARLRMCCNRLQLPGIKHVIVTLFREPLARYVSEFYQVAHNRRVVSSWDWCMKRIPPLSLTDFFRMPVSFPFQSRMTKLLSGSPVQTGAAGEDWTVLDIRQKALGRAIGVVRSTEDFLFGLAEELDLTLELFQFVFRRIFKAPSSCHSHQNTTHGGCAKVELGLHDLHGRPLTLTDEQLRLFHKNNREEKIVYNLAAEVFRGRIQAMRSLQALGSDFAIDRRCAKILEVGEQY